MSDHFTDVAWLDIAKQPDEFAVMKAIDSAITKPEDFREATDAIALCAYAMQHDQKIRVLDFGCGMARNSVGMVKYTHWDVSGYDSEPMIQRARQHYGPVAGMIDLSSDWEAVRLKKFDLIMCCLVLQHIPVEELDAYLSDMKAMTGRLLVIGRGWNDYYPNTWELIQRHWRVIRHDPRLDLTAKPTDEDSWAVLEPL